MGIASGVRKRWGLGAHAGGVVEVVCRRIQYAKEIQLDQAKKKKNLLLPWNWDSKLK